MAKFVWQDGTLVSKAKVEVEGTIYEVDPEEYSGSTPLSASNLNTMVDNIYDDMTKSNVYSTTETAIGIWMGKTLYRKVVTGDLSSNSVSHGISNADFHRISGTYKNTAGTLTFPIPSVRPNSTNYQLGFWVSATEIVFEKVSGTTPGSTFEIVLEYTKN